MAKMTREQIMERQPIFDGLVKLYEEAFKGERKVLIIIDHFNVITADGGISFDSGEALAKHMAKEISDYITGATL